MTAFLARGGSPASEDHTTGRHVTTIVVSTKKMNHFFLRGIIIVNEDELIVACKKEPYLSGKCCFMIIQWVVFL
jgi:hypothetical protein